MLSLYHVHTSTFLTRSGREGIFPSFNAFSNKIKASIWAFNFAQLHQSADARLKRAAQDAQEAKGREEGGDLAKASDTLYGLGGVECAFLREVLGCFVTAIDFCA